jgi:hypothetical protein
MGVDSRGADWSKSASGGPAVERLAEELAARWAPFFERKGWSERLELLHQVHEQLQEDLGDLDLYCAVSPALIRKLIERWGGGAVTSSVQAHIYANSDDEGHRRAAGDWLGTHASESG